MATKLKLGTDNNWATKKGNLLAYNDENGNFKPIPFDVTRASTATRLNKAGLIETVEQDRPRVEFDNNDGYVILEPTRTNNLLRSEEFDNSAWTKFSAGTGTTPVVTANYTTSPDGSNNADRVIFDKGSGTGGSDLSQMRQVVTDVGQGVSSVYIKSNTSESYTMGIDPVGNATLITVTPEWQRFTYSETTNDRLALGLRGSQTSNFADVSVWGAQMEAGSYLTSYIPTSESAVTRTEDFCFINSGLQDILNTSEGTLFIDVEVPRVSSTGSFERIVLSDQNSETDRIIFDNYAGNWRALILSTAGNVNKTIVNVTANQRIRVAIAYSPTELRVSYDGNTATTTSGSYTPTTTLESFKFSNKDNGSKWQGKIYQAMYFNTALTNAELIQLTS